MIEERPATETADAPDPGAGPTPSPPRAEDAEDLAGAGAAVEDEVDRGRLGPDTSAPGPGAWPGSGVAGAEADAAEASQFAAEEEAALDAEAIGTEASWSPEQSALQTRFDPAETIQAAEDPTAAARAALGLEESPPEEDAITPEEAEAILGPPEAEADEVRESAEDVTVLEDMEVLDIYEEEPEPSPYDRPGQWFVVHTYSGYEKKVKSNLESRVKSLNLEDRIYEVVIPLDDVIEFKGGKKTVVQKKVFPGYLLVRLELDDDTWQAVRNTPGVTGFVGSGAKPTPLSRKEVESILRVRREGEPKKVAPRLEFEVGDQVRVTAGPFADFNGVIDEINVDQNTLKVLVNIFGRETPVTLDFGDVARL